MIFFRVLFQGPDHRWYKVQLTGQIVVLPKLPGPDELECRHVASEAIEQQIDKAATGLAARLKRDFFTHKESS